MIKLTYAQLAALQPCALESRKTLFGKRKTLTAAQALAAGASIPDLLWVAGRLGRKDLCVKFALACAQRVAHHNTDPRVQAALDATAAWIADPSEENRQATDATARAAWAAATRAADAAAWAADAAAEREAQRAIFLEIFGGA